MERAYLLNFLQKEVFSTLYDPNNSYLQLGSEFCRPIFSIVSHETATFMFRKGRSLNFPSKWVFSTLQDPGYSYLKFGSNFYSQFWSLCLPRWPFPGKILQNGRPSASGHFYKPRFGTYATHCTPGSRLRVFFFTNGYPPYSSSGSPSRLSAPSRLSLTFTLGSLSTMSPLRGGMQRSRM